MKLLIDEIRELERQKDAIEHKLEALRQLRAKISGEAPKPSAGTRRTNLKEIVIALLEGKGAEGLNAATAVDMAKNELGERLDRGSVSSLLSRLKADDAVWYDGKVYRLNKFKSAQSDSGCEAQGATVHALKNFG